MQFCLRMPITQTQFSPRNHTQICAGAQFFLLFFLPSDRSDHTRSVLSCLNVSAFVRKSRQVIIYNI